MAAFTNDGEAQVLEYLLRGTAIQADGFGGSTAWTPSTTGGTNQGIYIGLFTSTPGEAGTGTEVSTTNTGYSRQLVAFSAIASVSGSSDTTVGTAITGPDTTAITWTATGDWATGATTVSEFALFMGSGALNKAIIYGTLTNPKNVANGDTVTLSADGLSITLK